MEFISESCPFNPEWLGDGYCDDQLNHKGCHYDKGDCCDTNASHKFCKQCQCLIPVEKLEISNCSEPHLVRDGECDDHLNTLECGLDGGDCCIGDSIFCNDCVCKLPDWPDVTIEIFYDLDWQYVSDEPKPTTGKFQFEL